MYACLYVCVHVCVSAVLAAVWTVMMMVGTHLCGLRAVLGRGGVWTCVCVGPCRALPLLWLGTAMLLESALYSHALWVLIMLRAPELYRALLGNSYVVHELCDLRQATWLSEPLFPYPEMEVTG